MPSCVHVCLFLSLQWSVFLAHDRTLMPKHQVWDPSLTSGNAPLSPPRLSWQVRPMWGKAGGGLAGWGLTDEGTERGPAWLKEECVWRLDTVECKARQRRRLEVRLFSLSFFLLLAVLASGANVRVWNGARAVESDAGKVPEAGPSVRPRGSTARFALRCSSVKSIGSG